MRLVKTRGKGEGSKRGRPKEEHSETLRFRVKASVWLKLNEYAIAHRMPYLSTAARQIISEFLCPENTNSLRPPTD